MTLADPIDRAVAQAFQRTEKPEPAPLPPSRHQLARTLVQAMGVETMDPLTVEVAAIIFSFDQEAIEQPWHRLSEHRRQPYYDIAEAAIDAMRERLGPKGVRA